MELIARLHPPDGTYKLDLEAWLLFCAAHSNFRPMPERQGKNPFTSELISIPSPNCFEVFNDDRLIGSFSWADDQIAVRGDPNFMLPLANSAAAAISSVVEIHRAAKPAATGHVASSRDIFDRYNKPRSR